MFGFSALSMKGFVFVPVLLLAVSCSKQEPVGDEGKENKATVIAVVNGEDITEKQLALAAARSRGSVDKLWMDEAYREKMLESLVRSRVIAQRSKTTLTEDDIDDIAGHVAAYKEELLVKRYLKKHVTAEPVSNEMIMSFYKKYPEKFGQKTRKKFRLMSASSVASGPKRNKLIKQFSELEFSDSWEKSAGEMGGDGVTVRFKELNVYEEAMGENIRAILQSTAVGEISKLHFDGGGLVRIHVVSEEITPAKNLSEVSQQIRKMLAPIKVKEALQRLSDRLLKESKIQYL